MKYTLKLYRYIINQEESKEIDRFHFVPGDKLRDSVAKDRNVYFYCSPRLANAQVC